MTLTLAFKVSNNKLVDHMYDIVTRQTLGQWKNKTHKTLEKMLQVMNTPTMTKSMKTIFLSCFLLLRKMLSEEDISLTTFL